MHQDFKDVKKCNEGDQSFGIETVRVLFQFTFELPLKQKEKGIGKDDVEPDGRF